MSKKVLPSTTNDILFEYLQVGESTPTILFFNGFRMRLESWDKVYAPLSPTASMLLFNRLGVGHSCKADKNQDAKTVVEAVHDMVVELNIQIPYILVAHSLGGIFVNLYARTYPCEVGGVVFVEASHPDEIAKQRAHRIPAWISVSNEAIKKIEIFFDPFKYSEDESILESIEQISTANVFPDIPIAVVTGTNNMPFAPKEPFEIHLNHQMKLLELSSDSTQFLCQESGHFPQITQPKIVIEAINFIIDKCGSSI